MRIAVLTSLYPGPPKPFEGVFAERRWLGMQARGHDVRVVHPLPRAPWPLGGRYAAFRAMPAHEDRGGMPVERPRYAHVPRAHGSNMARFARAGVRAVLAGPRPDVAVLDYAWPAAAAAAGLRAAGVPVVINGRGSDVLQVAQEAGLCAVLAAGLKAAGNWSAVSQDLVEAMDRLGERPGHGVLVPNGVDLELFRPLPSDARALLARDFGMPVDGPLVVCVGHLIPRKDPLLALAGFLAGAPDSARLVFIGRGPLEPELHAAIAASGQGARIRLLGELEPQALVEFYRAADVLLLTSFREGRPNVVLEALACGTPVVATRAGGTAELVPGFEERLIVDERTPAAVGARLADVLQAPPAPAALRALVEPLSWRASFEALELCLERAMHEDRAR